jgi:hypothetical protein
VNRQVIIKGVLIFLAIYAVNVAFTWYVTSEHFSWDFGAPEEPPVPGGPSVVEAPVLTAVVGTINGILGALVWLVPGIVAGWSAKKAGLGHGAVIGAVGYMAAYFLLTLFPQLGFSDSRNVFEFIYGAAGVAFLCSLAGGVGELYAVRRLRA